MKNERKWTKNQLKVIKDYFDLKKYESYCRDLKINPNDNKSKVMYGNMLIGVYQYKIQHNYIER